MGVGGRCGLRAKKWRSNSIFDLNSARRPSFHSKAKYSNVQQCTAKYSKVQQSKASAAKCSKVQQSMCSKVPTAKYSKAQQSTAQYSNVQQSAAKCSKVQQKHSEVQQRAASAAKHHGVQRGTSKQGEAGLPRTTHS
jgi:hypothetical protein